MRGGGKGNRKEQTIRQKAKRQLATRLAEEARKLAREASTARGKGRPAGSQSKDQEQKAKWIRRRLCGKQKPLGVTAFAKTAMAKLAAARAEAAAQQAKGKAQEKTAEEVQTKIIGLAQIASQAKMEAEQARARAADKQATENKAIAEHATEYADNLWKLCSRLLVGGRLVSISARIHPMEITVEECSTWAKSSGKTWLFDFHFALKEQVRDAFHRQLHRLPPEFVGVVMDVQELGTLPIGPNEIGE